MDSLKLNENLKYKYMSLLILDGDAALMLLFVCDLICKKTIMYIYYIFSLNNVQHSIQLLFELKYMCSTMHAHTKALTETALPSRTPHWDITKINNV